MKKMIKTLPVFVLVLFMVACGGGKKNYKKLTANEWVLEKVEFADSVEKIVIPGELAITFADSNNTVYGNAPCNRFFGGFTAEEETLAFGNIASTMAYCLEMPFESAYHAWLASVKTYEVNDEKLVLRDGDNKLVLHYKKK